MFKVAKINRHPKTAKFTNNSKTTNARQSMGLQSSRFRYNQLPVETPDGVITVFTLPNTDKYTSGLLEVFLDGLKQTKDTDYSETTSTTFTMLFNVESDEALTMNYITKL